MPMSIEDMQDSLTIEEFAKVIRQHRRTAERVIYDPENGIDYVRVGTGRGSIRIAKRSVNDYLNRNTHRAAANQPRKSKSA